MDDPELIRLLDYREAAEGAVKAAKEVIKADEHTRDKIKAAVTGKEKVLVGGWIVSGKWTKAKNPWWSWKAKRAV